MKHDWEYKKLGEVITPAKVCKNKSGEDLPILSITMRSGIVFQKDRFSKQIASVDTSTYKVVNNGQLVIAFPIDEGLIYTQDIVKKGIMSPAYNIWDVDYTNLDRRFLVMYLHSSFAMNYYKSKLKGTTQRRRALSKDDLLSMPLVVPPLPTQQSIVSELDSLSKIIADCKETLKDYDALEQSIFYDMFGDPVKNEKGWEVKKLGECCSDKKNIKRASKAYSKNDTICYIDISSIDKKNSTITHSSLCMFGEAPSRAQQCVQNGDVLISLVRPNLKNIAVVETANSNNVASSGFCVLRPKESTSMFIKHVVLTDSFTERLCERTAGANYPAVKEEDIKQQKIGYPPLVLQQTFADKIAAIEQMKAETKATLQETETLFQARMDYWFN